METENKYLSLKAAAQLYGYTRDHLGLMIRQNKLRGIKLGSYYVTTNEWMTEYIKNYADLNHPKIKSKLSNKFLLKAVSSPSALSGKKMRSVEVSSESAKSASKNPTDPTIKTFNHDLQNDLQKEILDVFSSLRKTPNTAVDPDSFFEPPYLILPIRKMEENEKRRILKLLEQNSDKTDLT